MSVVRDQRLRGHVTERWRESGYQILGRQMCMRLGDFFQGTEHGVGGFLYD